MAGRFGLLVAAGPPNPPGGRQGVLRAKADELIRKRGRAIAAVAAGNAGHDMWCCFEREDGTECRATGVEFRYVTYALLGRVRICPACFRSAERERNALNVFIRDARERQTLKNMIQGGPGGQYFEQLHTTVELANAAMAQRAAADRDTFGDQAERLRQAIPRGMVDADLIVQALLGENPDCLSADPNVRAQHRGLFREMLRQEREGR